MNEQECAFQKAVQYYQSALTPGDQQTLIAFLRETQEIYGYIPKEKQEEIAALAGTPLSLIAALVKRIPGLKESAARHEIVVCTGPRCSAKNGARVLQSFEDALHIHPGETTEDGRFRLRTQNCLKKCGTAPNATIDGVLYPSLKPVDIPQILKKYS
ncbi:NADH-quinone oxidoreductase subunit NuoE family protein [Anaeromassilibacillus senegalensis]|uniref:NADH-quinone oxidoreductase subunit NuoE family protein n=1 Tax=Anaeromassilibacillus senegalensis TaxID=1673717 RepID=UPI00068317B5|nr:NAD(P)H-dependent oxidoreductase subunit E [Anaeromassilibacillus senegalensis]